MGGEEGLRLSKVKVDKMKAWEDVEKVFEEGKPVSAQVTAAVKGGVTISVCGARCFVPASQLDVRYVEDMKSFVGQTLEFMPLEFDKSRPKAIFSRRALLEAQKKEREAAVFDSLEEGQILKGTVKRLTDYGVFVDIGGVDGLVHISELSWQRVKHPSEVVKPGDEVSVFVKSFDAEAKRISLSIKNATRDPWLDKAEKLSIGQVVDGKVVKTLEFGAFVNIGNDLEGLVHLSELSAKRVAKTEDAVKAGDSVRVKIIRIDMENKKIGLSIKQVAEDKEKADFTEYLAAQNESHATIGDQVGELKED
jgi:ribosomal protein S1